MLSSLGAARLRAFANTDPAKYSDFTEKVCQNTKENELTQIKGGYGVITLFHGVSSVVPTLTKKLGHAPAVAILAENDIDVRAVVCAEFGYRADEQWSLPHKGLLSFM